MYRFKNTLNRGVRLPALVIALLLLVTSLAQARIDGVEGQSFNLTAMSGKATTADGSGLFFWGYANAGSKVQYPGPTLIVTQGQEVTVTLTNQINTPVSIVFPGQSVTATGGVPGLLTREVLPGGTAVTYTFTPNEPGTYLYYSGTEPDLQVEMGLVGAMVVRPSNFSALSPTAYGDERSAYDYEYLFLLTEMSPDIHQLVELGRRNAVKTTESFPFSWFINGRGGPDTLAPAGALASWLPNQPYNCFPQATPGDRVLLRVIGAGRDNHPLHTHGNNLDIIARDGQLLTTNLLDPAASRPAEVGVVPNLSVSSFTINVQPGATYDAVFAWTGRELGWDFYGHAITAPTAPGEVYSETTLAADLLAGASTLTVTDTTGLPTNHRFRAVLWSGGPTIDTASNREVVLLTAAGGNDFTVARGAEGTTALPWVAGANLSFTDHGTKLPVILPDIKDLAFGQFYSGSPYLGSAGQLPPGEGGFNPNAGFAFMWHSHTEKELTNNNVFPGGLMTMFIVLPPGTTVE